MRILCVYPALLSGWASYTLHGNNESSYMNHGFAMLSSVLKRAGHDPFLVDLRSLSGWDHFEQIVSASEYSFSMISFLSCDEAFTREATKRMKRMAPEKLIVGGGIHLSVTQATEYPNIDVIVHGEGEERVLGIATEIEAGRRPLSVYTLKPISDLDLLPFVDRGFFNSEMEQTTPLLALLPEPFVTMVAGRGCWGRCTFCAPTRDLISGRSVRIRSPQHFIEEIRQVNASLGGIGSLMIHDDLLGTNRWMEEFVELWRTNFPRIPFWCQLRADTVLRMKELIPELAEIGLTWVSLGLESGSQRMLDFLQKGTTVEQNIEASEILHQNDVNIFANYIVGLPTETSEDIDGMEQMLSIIRPEQHAQSVYTSYPGSHLYEWIEANDYWVPGDEHYRRIRYPWERKIKGIDYDYIFGKQAEWSAKYTSPLRQWSGRNGDRAKRRVGEEEQPSAIPEAQVCSDGLGPKVSIITISYNRPKMLREAIQSMFNQTMTDWEMIIVNNSLPTNTAVREVCDWGARDRRVKVIHHEANVDNLPICWNEALDLATGRYWGTLDDDNRKHPTFCEEMAGYLDEHPENDAVVCGSRSIGNERGEHIPRPEQAATLGTNNFIDSGEILYRPAVIEKIGYFDERMTALDDWEYVLRFFKLVGKKRVAFLNKVLTDYRWHTGKRMERSKELKIEECTKLVHLKTPLDKINVMLEVPERPEVTQSQRQLADGVRAAIEQLPFAALTETHPDVIVALGPIWHLGEERLSQLSTTHRVPVMGLLIEDPQAIFGNTPVLGNIDWLVTNDIHAFDLYKTVFHTLQQIYHWNCLSISESVLELCSQAAPVKEYDVCFIGYPYPSRVKFVKQMQCLLPQVSLVLVGDTWDSQRIPGATVYPTLNEIDTAAIGLKSKIVLCKHRTDEDIGGFPVVVPGSVNRGYIECAYHALVMIDKQRWFSPFTDEVEWYDSAEDAAEKIKHYLANPDLITEKAEKAFALAPQFTYKERVGKILNAWRSPRYNVKVA